MSDGTDANPAGPPYAHPMDGFHRSLTATKEMRVQATHTPATTTDTDFSGLWIPLVTPFRAGAVDHAALDQLVRRLRADGVSGFVACGSTGEAAALDTAEQLAVLDTTLQAADGCPVVMGMSDYHLAQALDRVRELACRPIAGLLVPAPHYIRPSQAGLLHWFHCLADASRVPLIVYDIPARTGVSLDRETLLELACHPGIRAIKDCGADTAKTLALIAQGKLQVLAGDDLQMFATVAQGGAGAIAASAHLLTPAFVQLIRRLRTGDCGDVRDLWLTLVPWIEAVFAEPNPAPVKAMLASLGVIDGALRAPMTVCSARHLASMRQLALAPSMRQLPEAS